MYSKDLSSVFCLLSSLSFLDYRKNKADLLQNKKLKLKNTNKPTYQHSSLIRPKAPFVLPPTRRQETKPTAPSRFRPLALG